MSDGIQSNLGNVLTDEELAEQRRLVQFYNYPWPLGPVIIERGEQNGRDYQRCAIRTSDGLESQR